MVGAKDVWEGAKWAWDNRAEITRMLSAFRRWWKRAKILIIGPGGTGKTTLAHILSGGFDWLQDSPWRYHEDIGIKRYRVKNDPSAEVTVYPGQEHRRASAWAGIGREIAAGKYSGVIFVGAYGYHTISRVSYKQHRLYNGNKDKFVSDYAADRRGDEIRCIKHLLPHLVGTEKKLWFASVIAKQDLWVADETTVLEWYRDGEYGAVLKEIDAQRPTAIIRREEVPVSLVISNFTTDRDEVLKKNMAGYDQQAQVQSVRHLIEVLDGLRSWESGK